MFLISRKRTKSEGRSGNAHAFGGIAGESNAIVDTVMKVGTGVAVAVAEAEVEVVVPVPVATAVVVAVSSPFLYSSTGVVC